MARVLVGGFSMESNTFAPGETTLDDLRAQMFGVGAEVDAELPGRRERARGALGGARGRRARARPVARHLVGAGPSARARRPAEIVRLVLGPCDDSIDGAYLMLHGACVAHDEDDPEGALLDALRERLGPEKPIVVSLDCHANLTARMVAAADAFTAYRTCPHVDTRRTGEQAGRLLAEILAGRVRPTTARGGPADDHAARAARLEPRPFPPADGAERRTPSATARSPPPCSPSSRGSTCPSSRWKAVVTTDGDAAAAQRAAERIMDEAWSERHAFLGGVRLRIDEALAAASRQAPPVVLADAGDATNGGAIGDSTELLRAALRARRGRASCSRSATRTRRHGRSACGRGRDASSSPSAAASPAPTTSARAVARAASGASSTARSSTRTP